MTTGSMSMNFLLGLAAGATIFIGLPLARWRGVPERLRGVLSLAAAGLLLFLVIEVGYHAMEAVRSRAGSGSPIAMIGAGLLLFGGFAFGLIGLTWLEQRHGHDCAEETQDADAALHVATGMAVGIGLHSFAEGLAIGQSLAGGQAALGTLLLTGAALHNTLEGFSIAAPLAGRPVGWGRLAGLGLLAGGPTALGALLGGAWVNPLAELLFLSVSTGSLVYVIRELLRLRFKTLSDVAAMAALAAGLFLGFGMELAVGGAAHERQHAHGLGKQTVKEGASGALSGREQETIPAAMTTLAGEPVTLERFRGKVVLLDVWATWCPPCVEALPRLQALHERYRARGFAVVGVSLDAAGASTVKPFIARRNITYPMLLDTQGTSSAHQLLGVKTLPALFLVDASGQIIGRWTGEAIDEGEIEAAVINALKDKQ